jgi:hypothetical protein
MIPMPPDSTASVATRTGARYAVADEVLGLLIGEIVQRLQHHDLELQDPSGGLATGVTLAPRASSRSPLRCQPGSTPKARSS